MCSLEAFIDFITGPQLRCRSGILLFSEEYVGQERICAQQLALRPVDYVIWYLEHHPNLTSRLYLSNARILEDFDSLCAENSSSRALLVYNVDLALYRLDRAGRIAFLDGLEYRFVRRPVGVIIGLPEKAFNNLFSNNTRERWENQNRLAYCRQEEGK
jgi:hypothetical protein